jgi:PIN domain nuclease of toxin-antitoxin system
MGRAEVNYLLDTNAWLFGYAKPEVLSAEVRDLLSDESEVFGISKISLWEVGKKHQIGKLLLDAPFERWLKKALRPNFVLLDLSEEIIVEAMRLPDFPNNDPADELIVATANVHGLTLLTCDKLLQNYQHSSIRYFKPKKA